MSNISRSLAASKPAKFSPDDTHYFGDGNARTAGGDIYASMDEEQALNPEEEHPCWSRLGTSIADDNQQDRLVLNMPNVELLRAPDYVMRPLLPRKSVVVLGADSGTGKSTLAAHIEALASRGELDEGRPLKCLVITTEDSADDLAAQYAAEGADVQNYIRTVSIESDTIVASDGSPALKTIGAKDLPRIISAAYKIRPDIIRFDPLHRFATGDWNSGKSAEFMDELTVMAQSLNCCVLGIMHTKKGAMNAKEAITGTGQWVAKSRSAAVMAAPDDDKNHVVLQQIKSNRSATQNYEIEFATKPLTFSDGSVFDVRYVASMTPTTRTADDVFAQNMNDRAAFVDRDELSELARWVYDTIEANGGHMLANDVFKRAENRPEKWSRGQVRKARKEAGVQLTRQASKGAQSIWFLPTCCTEAEAKFWGTIPAEKERNEGVANE